MEEIPLLHTSPSYQSDYDDIIISSKSDYSPRVWKFLYFTFVAIFTILLIDLWSVDSKDSKLSSKCDTVLDDCLGVPLNDTVLPPFLHYLQDHVISPKYGISHCIIPKVMSTIATAALCYLSNSTNFVLQNRKISTESWYNRLCPYLDKKTFDEVKPFVRDPRNNIIMVRNPYNRFVSGFVDKCVKKDDPNNCYGCGSDIRCFLDVQYKIFKNITAAPMYNVTDTHFAPQTWYCQMEKNFRNSTVIRYGRSQIERAHMIDDYVKVFENANVPENEIAEVRKEFTVGKSHHTTTGSDIRKYYDDLIRRDHSIRRAIQRFYYWDFKILGYEI